MWGTAVVAGGGFIVGVEEGRTSPRQIHQELSAPKFYIHSIIGLFLVFAPMTIAGRFLEYRPTKV